MATEENSNDDGKDGVAAIEVHARDAEEEGIFHDCAHSGTIHVHGRAQWHDDVGDFLGDSTGFGRFHVGRNGGDRRAGAKRYSCRFEEIAPHDGNGMAAAAIPGIEREKDEHVEEANAVINEQRLGIAPMSSVP